MPFFKFLRLKYFVNFPLGIYIIGFDVDIGKMII